jgi:hypothetical protein
MNCPRCNAAADDRPECPHCGVVLAKARPPRERRPTASAESATRAPRRAALRPALDLPLGLALIIVATIFYVRQNRPATPSTAASPQENGATLPAVVAPPDDPLPRPAIPLRQAPVPMPSAAARLANADEGDARAATALVRKLNAGAPVDSSDVVSAERLHVAYPAAARSLLAAVLTAAAGQARATRRYDDAAGLLERALAVDPTASEPRRALLAVRVDQGNWPAVERTALELQRSNASDGDTIGALAYALVRQDRSAEAIAALTRHLETHGDPQAAALLARLRRDSSAETTLRQQTLAHFHVRYDGEAHEDVGREVLRVLDRHYATLARTFDHEPTATIPVVLLSREAYYDGTGAPAWSGGHYDAFDGRVRIPIGGLTASLTPELDGTVLHELTHAFVADLSAGLAPRELQEGLAQLMEGRRLSTLGDGPLRALASGRLAGVHGYYLAALAFVEDLVAQRGQGGINDVLSAMARTGSADTAFREVYGRDYQSSLAETLARLRARYGG